MYINFSKVEEWEEPFRINQYSGRIDLESYFQYHKGDIPILISMPHATRHVNKEGQIKLSDSYTGSIGILLHQLTGSHLIYLTKQANRNPNSEWRCEYREKLAEVVQKGNIKLVIDLHAMARKRDYDIDFGTSGGESISKEHLNRIQKIFHQNGIIDTKENYLFGAPYPTITYFCKEVLKTEAIQIEIHKKYREPLFSPNEFEKLIISLTEVIHQLK